MNEKRRRLTRFAEQREKVVTIAQLYELGFTVGEIKGLLKQGVLHRIHGGVSAVGHRNLTVPRAATRRDAGGGAASVPQRMDGSRVPRRGQDQHAPDRDPVPTGHTPPQRIGLILRRTTNTIDELEVGEVSGLPTATVVRVLIELSRTATHEQLDWLLTP
jgi:hypothetical protein